MANNQFQGSLYRTQRAMLDAIAYAWVGGGGEARLGDFDEVANEALAADCIAGWRLDLPEQGWPGDDPGISHMEAQAYDEDDLAEAFARLHSLLVNGGS
jgi:hypothetical protein